ncbi:MAG: hypothetical protein APF80_11805 [Alphaproteobacteria bacterium BRH_c36]|nr:MAG: hypothetical protein APF80_11805 [Alphaproteobacteria bacterium BRH_c36]
MARVDLKSASLAGTPLGGIIALTVTATREERASAVAVARESGLSIAIPFARFNDGRGFSIARLLRSEHDFSGEILATGHTIPDQALHLLRCGFDAVELSDSARLPQWKKSLKSCWRAYQTAARNPLTLRREAALKKNQNSRELEKAA